MHIDPLYAAKFRREAAAQIIRHCKFERACDPVLGGRAALRDEARFEDAGAYLAQRGFGTVKPNTMHGRGTVFTLRA
jgi:hypothetical protein